MVRQEAHGNEEIWFGHRKNRRDECDNVTSQDQPLVQASDMPVAIEQLPELMINLERDSTRPTIVGRVINGATGKPIAHALVRTTQGSGVLYGLTDAFGRYAILVHTPESVVVETNGAFLKIGDAAAPYHTQRVDLSGRLLDGQVFELDFSMVQK